MHDVVHRRDHAVRQTVLLIMALSVAMIMAVEIRAIAMVVPHFVHPQKIKQIKQFAIKNLFALWANVQAQFALHTGSSHVSALLAREMQKLNHVSCVVKCLVKISHAKVLLTGIMHHTMFRICTQSLVGSKKH